MIKYLDKENFNDLIKEGKVIVDFYADWCGPCKMIGEELEKLTDLNILKVNVDKHNELSSRYGVMSIPNVLFFKDGELQNQSIGFVTSEELQKIYDEI